MRQDAVQKTQVFKGMSFLVEVGRLVFPKQVLGELERVAHLASPDTQYLWAKQNVAKAAECVLSFRGGTEGACRCSESIRSRER